MEAGWLGCRGGEGDGEMQQLSLESRLKGCVSVGGGETLSKPMGVYIMLYGYAGTHKSLFH